MVDVGGDDGAPGGNFIADELGGNVFRQAGTEAFPGMLLAQNLAADTFATHVFANGDELHLRRDDPLAGVVQLGNAFPGDGAFGRQQAAEAQLIETVIGQPRFGIGRAAFAERSAVVTRVDPRLAQLCQPLADINANIRVAIRAGGVIYRDRFIGFVPGVIFIAADEGRAELNFTHRDADIRL